ncbi:MAG TPA: hypothetical protein VMW50_14815, partial [Dehalococcoidia bacterium]|nr:hypothetical protein [Dehalococcoidia bacterium]
VLLVVVEENDGGTLSHRISWSEANQLPLGYWPMFVHAQIPAEVELKAKIAELEAIIKASQEPRPISTAPQDDSHFIGYTRKYGWHETCWSDVQAKQRSFSKGENTWPFTYWIPCPNPVIKDQP